MNYHDDSPINPVRIRSTWRVTTLLGHRACGGQRLRFPADVMSGNTGGGTMSARAAGKSGKGAGYSRHQMSVNDERVPKGKDTVANNPNWPVVRQGKPKASTA
ncbi:hypothetical protein C8J56DRAFT_887970 [Mycena floridula]|nr:hypothetical protein C8J56DRAFT_887970 [Mycena floridula]